MKRVASRAPFRRVLLALALALGLVVGPAASALALVSLEVQDRLYGLLERLEAEGLLERSLLMTRPLELEEALRLVRLAKEKAAAEGASDFLSSQIGWAEAEIARRLGPWRPLEGARLEVIYSDQVDQELNYNNDGQVYFEGMNSRLSLYSYGVFQNTVGYEIRPSFTLKNGDSLATLDRAYVKAEAGGWQVELGRDAQWWGPGHDGSVLLSNNARPMTIAKLTNPAPATLPWFFEYLGPMRFILFVTRLEKERDDYPRPYLWGMRVEMRPSEYFELGLQRTALLGGQGRGTNLGTWSDSLFGLDNTGSEDEPGDQRAGFDMKIFVPLQYQPFTLYLERIGEDRSPKTGLPYMNGVILGAYLPRVYTLERLSVLAEVANTNVPGQPDTFYNHFIYTDGYTYYDNIIGHHIGTSTRSLYVEARYTYGSPYEQAWASLMMAEHNMSADTSERLKETVLSAGADLYSDESLGVTLSGSLGRLLDREYYGQSETSGLVRLEARYRIK